MQFDYHTETPFTESKLSTLTIADIIFSRLEHRPENSKVILSHWGEQFVEVTLPELRYIISTLSLRLQQKQVKKGETVMLLSLPGCNELVTALLFASLTSMGIRVIMPIFPESAEAAEWIEKTNTVAVFASFGELRQLKDYEREKEMSEAFRNICTQKAVTLFDTDEDLNISTIITDSKTEPAYHPFIIPPDITSETDAVIVSTSGSSGKTKLVVYKHGAYTMNCLSWAQGGLFSENQFGNTGFTPLFTHTIGIRSFINALWTGKPVCLIITDWFTKRPESVSYLLRKMKPEHIIGGPSMFNALLELYRNFPELKTDINRHLKACISIGAPFSAATATLINDVTGIPLYNAFGTTETQMACIAMNGSSNTPSLGKPLPGVQIGLKKIEGSESYKFYVHTPFHCSQIIGEPANGKYRYTGDLVKLSSGNDILYERREGVDFMKDDFGVKISLVKLKEHYNRLYSIATHIELLPLNNVPGLAALVFAEVNNALNKNQVQGLIRNLNRELKKTLEPFDFEHSHLSRVALISEPVPLTKKGTVSWCRIHEQYASLIDDLKNTLCDHENIINTEIADAVSDFTQYMNPDLGRMLKILGLDVVYHRGEKDTLFYKKQDKEIAVLDLAGGYGGNLIGHNHPAIKQAMISFISNDKIALNSQGSIPDETAVLAKKLNQLVSTATGKTFKVQFANSGTEGVDIAIQHAYFEWRKGIEKIRDQQLQLYGSIPSVNAQRIWEDNMKKVEEILPSIIAVKGCFHGYNSGTRSLLKNTKRRSYFSGLLKINPLFIDNDDSSGEAINHYTEQNFIELYKIIRKEDEYIIDSFRHSSIIASIIEPVMGEGGIQVLNPSIADHLSVLPFPLISDEIQCGLGRTGSIPAYHNASYYVFGKALGGGYEKIAAVLVDDSRFQSDFPKYSSSTFANGCMSASAGSAVVDLIGSDKIAEQSLQKGAYLKSALSRIASLHPSVIQRIEGKGLMLGIYFNESVADDKILLRSLFQLELAGYLFSAWIFNKYNIRIFPTLSSVNSWRVEPSYLVSTEQIDYFTEALDRLCCLIESDDIYTLFSFLMNDDVFDDRNPQNFDAKFPSVLEEPEENAIKAGFISHFTFPVNELKILGPGLNKASDTGLRILFNKMQGIMAGKPIKVFAKNLMNGKIHLTFYVLPLDTAQFEGAHKWGNKKIFIKKIQDTVDILSKENVTHISLGGYASIITNNGLSLAEHPSTKIITGNTLTVASCLHHLSKHIKEEAGTDKLKIAIVGASGNIGTGLSTAIAQNIHSPYSLLLVGNNLKRLQQLQKNINAEHPFLNIAVETDISLIKAADIILCCTNTNAPFIFPHHIHQQKPVFLIDISVPVALSPSVHHMKNVTVCGEASYIPLPDDEDLKISTHTPKGTIFCCAAEVLLAGRYDPDVQLKGRVNASSVTALYKLGKREHFFTTNIPEPI